MSELIVTYGREGESFEQATGYSGRSKRFELHLEDSHENLASRGIKEPTEYIDSLHFILGEAVKQRIMGDLKLYCGPGFKAESKRLVLAGQDNLYARTQETVGLVKSAYLTRHHLLLPRQLSELEGLVELAMTSDSSKVTEENILRLLHQYNGKISVKIASESLRLHPELAKRLLQRAVETGRLHLRGNVYSLDGRIKSKEEKELEALMPRRRARRAEDKK